MSRTWKVLPNHHLRVCVEEAGAILEDLDGEIVVGPPTAPNVYNTTMSGIMSFSGVPDITYMVFDNIDNAHGKYKDRLQKLVDVRKKLPPWVKIVPQKVCKTAEEIEEVEQHNLLLGYEGVIVRSPFAPYKQGRSTVNEGYLLKLKRYNDAEAIVIGYAELMHNDNEATIDVQGHTKRSSHQAGQRPGGVLGALVCRLESGVVFSIGSGFDMAQRAMLWQARENLPGKIVKFKYMPHGQLNAPRLPIFLGFRSEIDL
jgi:DNA ligase-1